MSLVQMHLQTGERRGPKCVAYGPVLRPLESLT